MRSLALQELGEVLLDTYAALRQAVVEARLAERIDLGAVFLETVGVKLRAHKQASGLHVLDQPGRAVRKEVLSFLEARFTSIERGHQATADRVALLENLLAEQEDVANVNFAANISARGLRESCGMMVNYVYSDTWLRQLGRTMQSLLT